MLIFLIICLIYPAISAGPSLFHGIDLSDSVIGLLGLPYARPPIKDDRFLTSYLQKLDTDRKYDKWPNRCIKEYILEETSEDCLYVSLLRHKDTKTKTNTLLFVTNEDLSVNKLLNMVKPELNIAVGHIRDGVLGYAGGLPLSISDTVNMVKLLKAYGDTLLIKNLTVMAEGTVAESVNGAMNEIGYIIDQAILINGNQLTRTYDRQDYQRITEEMIKRETSCELNDDDEILKCLREKSLEDILSAGHRIKKAFHPMGDPFRVPFVEKLSETQVPTILGLYKRPTADYPLDANFTEAYSQKDFKRFLSLLIPDTLHKNARLLRRQIMHQYIYTKGEKTNLYFLFEQLKNILLDRDFLAPTYKLTMHLADRKNTVWLLEHGIDNPPRNCWQNGGWDDIQPFCDKLTAYFTRFAEKGAPTEDSCNPVNPTFPAMRSTKRDYYVIMHADGKPEWEFRYHKEAVELWNHVLPALDKLELTGDGDAIFKNMNTLMAKKSENDYVLKSMTHPKEEKLNSDLKKDKSEL